jgi:zinc protease
LYALLAAAVLSPAGLARPEVASSRGPVPGDELLPSRPGLEVGRLANGLVFYLQRNARPAQRLEIRLAVDVGSIDERDGQQGYAHFLEHLAFRTTRRFPAGQLASFLAAAGMQQGADLNATTGYDETVYRLRLPTGDPAVVRRGFELVADWAGGLAIEDAEVDKERGAILEEWSARRHASSSTFDLHLPVLLEGTRYPRRPPVGERDVLAAATAADLRTFYRGWYRPDRMAVVAIGDLEPAVAEAAIREAFAGLPAPPPSAFHPPREAPPERGAPRVSVATDPAAQVALVSLAFSRPAAAERSVADYRSRLTRFLFHRVLNARLAEVAQQPEPPFALARTSEVRGVRAATTTLAVALFQPGSHARALASLVAETRRVAEHGVGVNELARHRADLLRDMESAAAEEDRTESSALADECTRNFLAAEPLPGLAYEYRLARRLLPGLEPAEIQAFARDAFPLSRVAVLVTLPGKPAAPPPPEAEVLQALAAARAQPLTARVDRPSTPLVAVAPVPGEIAARRQVPAAGLTEWTLANGIKVVARPTAFQRDEILFTSFRAGGFASVPERDLVPAWTAAEAVRLGGIGNLDLPSLRAALAGKAVEVTPFIGERTAGLRGSSSRADLPVAFQLLHLYLSSPRADPQAFAAYRGRLKELVGNRGSDPEALLDDAEDAALAGGDPRHRAWDARVIDEMDLQRSLAVYRELLGNPQGFTFIFVGSFDAEELGELARVYLGSLPAGSPAASPPAAAAARPSAPPRGPVERAVAGGSERRSGVRLIFAGEMRWEGGDRTAVPALAELLSVVLQRRLRGDLAAVYEVAADSITLRAPSPHYEVRVRFSCAPERVDELVRAVLAEVDRLRAAGPSPADLASWRRAKLQRLQDDLGRNAFWLRSLEAAYAFGDEPASILDAEQRLRRLSPEALRAAALRYLDPQSLIKLVRQPAR